MERGAFLLKRIGNATRRGSEDKLIGQVLAIILATCIIARLLAHKLDVWFVPWLTSKMLDVCLPFPIRFFLPLGHDHAIAWAFLFMVKIRFPLAW